MSRTHNNFEYLTIKGNEALTLQGDATQWDDLRFPLQGQRLDVSAGRIDYNYDECTVDFQDNTRYPNEVICFAAQMPHAKKMDSNAYVHLHWLQNQNATPNWLIETWWYNNGDEVSSPTKTLSMWSSNELTYSSGTLAQITVFPVASPPANEMVSSILKIRLFRDTANASTLFTGADPYIGTVQADELDIHYEINTFGSKLQYMK